MVAVPVWALVAVGIFTVALLIIVGYLLRLMAKSIAASSNAAKADQEAAAAEQVAHVQKVGSLEQQLEALDKRVGDECTRIDKSFLEQQIANARLFVDRDMWTRDYVTLSNRMDGLHRRVDRFDRDPARRSKRPDETDR